MMHEWYWRAQWFWWAAAAAASASFVHVSLKGDLFLGFALKQEFNAFLFSFPSRENSTACKIESCSWPTVPKMNFELNWSLIGRVNVMLLFFIWGPKKTPKNKREQHSATLGLSGHWSHCLLGSRFFLYWAEKACCIWTVMRSICFYPVVNFPQPWATTRKYAAYMLFSRSC